VTYKIAAEGEQEAVESEMSLRGFFSLRSSKRAVELPYGMLHAYIENETQTFCGLATASLSLFPGIDWPGGVDLANARCGRCGESTVDH
jgi:hypothetical protein